MEGACVLLVLFCFFFLFISLVALMKLVIWKKCLLQFNHLESMEIWVQKLAFLVIVLASRCMTWFHYYFYVLPTCSRIWKVWYVSNCYQNMFKHACIFFNTEYIPTRDRKHLQLPESGEENTMEFFNWNSSIHLFHGMENDKNYIKNCLHVISYEFSSKNII